MARGKTKAAVFDSEVDDYIEQEMLRRGVKASPALNAIVREHMQGLQEPVGNKRPLVETKEINVKTNIKAKEQKMTEAGEEYDRRDLVKMVSKIHDKLPAIDQLCKDGECLKNDIAEIKQWRKDNEPDAACPSCKHITLKKGRKQQQFCKDCGDGPFEEEE